MLSIDLKRCRNRYDTAKYDLQSGEKKSASHCNSDHESLGQEYRKKLFRQLSPSITSQYVKHMCGPHPSPTANAEEGQNISQGMSNKGNMMRGNGDVESP